MKEYSILSIRFYLYNLSLIRNRTFVKGHSQSSLSQRDIRNGFHKRTQARVIIYGHIYAPLSLSRCTFYRRSLCCNEGETSGISFSFSSPHYRFPLSPSLSHAVSLINCRFSRSAFFSLSTQCARRTLRNSKDIWSLQEYLRPVSRVVPLTGWRFSLLFKQ